MPTKPRAYEYDVALSFAGEQRPTAKKLASLLRKAGLKVFYDDWEAADLWGRDLVQHLDEVYSRKALFCLIVISAEYVAKAWTSHELKSAQARAFRDRNDYILPLRVDDTPVPGIRDTTGFIDLRKRTLDQVVTLVGKKVKAAKAAAPAAVATAVRAKPKAVAAKKPVAHDLSGTLTIKKQFTEHDRDVFLDKAFATIAKVFKTSLASLAAKNKGKGIVGRFGKLTNNHFTAQVYKDGKCVSKCGIRLGGTGGWSSHRQIAYSDQPESTTNSNDWLTAVDDGQKLYLKTSGLFPMYGRPGAKDRMTPKEAAEAYWAKLMEPLQR